MEKKSVALHVCVAAWDWENLIYLKHFDFCQIVKFLTILTIYSCLTFREIIIISLKVRQL